MINYLLLIGYGIPVKRIFVKKFRIGRSACVRTNEQTEFEELQRAIHAFAAHLISYWIRQVFEQARSRQNASPRGEL